MTPFSDRLQQAFAALEQGRVQEAERLGRELLTENQSSGESLFLLGLIANQAGRYPESVQWLEQAAGFLPPSVRIFSALGGAYDSAGDFQRAAEYYTRCLQLDPQCSEAWHQLGNVCYAQRNMELAAQAYRKAADLDPGNFAIWNNLANTLRQLEALPEAIAAYDRALAGRPDDAVIRANRGRTLLAAGRLAEGFRDHEFRWEPLGLRRYPQPVWRGEHLPGKTLFVFAEQGVGDTIHFVRYLRLARSRVGRIILACQPSLISLLEHSACADVIIGAADAPPPFDTYVPLLHLPGVFNTTLESIPATVPYLSPEGAIPLPSTPTGHLKVGLTWAGNPAFLDDAIRSIPLVGFAGILDISGVSFFSMQLNVPADDEAFFQSSSLIKTMTGVKNFEETANLIRQLDLVISVDTAVAHLAGALGKPVWTLINRSPDWRWMLQRTDSPWYPTMRLYRQQRSEGWEPVLAQVAGELRKLVESRQPSTSGSD
ncbi:MAG TPA: tetratricopeptide repeat-containing glycosyltransferase family protein [Verrucomicrobiae bacterium]|nr:tetratricopeptide repeat-containing glycosyltransferase family protein [Verrucomicrobiae bacterium]